MKAGDLSRMTARWSENTTSSAVIGLPEANFLPWRILKVKVLPSGETVQDSATSPEIFETSFEIVADQALVGVAGDLGRR